MEKIGDSLVGGKDNIQIDWLVIFLVVDVYELKGLINKLKKDIKEIWLKDSVKIFFIQDSIQRIRNPNQVRYELKISEFKFSTARRTTRFQSVKIEGLDYFASNAYAEAIIALGQKYPSKNSILITWSHGAGIILYNEGLRSFYKRGDYSSINDFYLLRNPDIQIGLRLDNGIEKLENAIWFYKENLLECKNLEFLFVSEIANAIKGRLAKKFDLIVMNNCNTQILDCCYNLREISNYYIAPSTGIIGDGYDFVSLIQKINADDTSQITYKKLISDIIEGYWERNKEASKFQAIIGNNLAFLSQDWIDNFNAMIKYLMTNSAKTYRLIYDVTLNKIRKLGGGLFLFDAVTMFRYLNEMICEPEFEKLYFDFYSHVIARREYYKVGQELLNADLINKNKYGIESFSLYIYSTKETIVIADIFLCQYWGQEFNSEFVVKTNWDNLVIDYGEWLKSH